MIFWKASWLDPDPQATHKAFPRVYRAGDLKHPEPEQVKRDLRDGRSTDLARSTTSAKKPHARLRAGKAEWPSYSLIAPGQVWSPLDWVWAVRKETPGPIRTLSLPPGAQ